MTDIKNQAFQNVYDQLYDLFSYDPDSKRTSAANNVIVKLTPNKPLNPDDYENMYTPSNPKGERNPAYNFAALADAIPDGKGGNLSAIYKSIVDGVHIDDTMTKEKDKVYQEALRKLQVRVSEKMLIDGETKMVQVVVEQTPMYKGYCQAENRYSAALKEYYKTVNDPDLDSDDIASQGILREQKARLKMAYDNWTIANKDEVERLLATLATCANDALASMFADAKYVVHNYPDMGDGTTKFGPTAPLQMNWLPRSLSIQDRIDAVQEKSDDDIRKVRHQLEQAEEKMKQTEDPDIKDVYRDKVQTLKDRIMELGERCREQVRNIQESGASEVLQSGAVYSEFVIHSQEKHENEGMNKANYDVGVKASWGLFSVGGDGGYHEEKKSADDETSDIVISGKIAQIPLVRPWFNPLLFAAKDWTIKGFADGSISNGKGEGVLPMYATSLIVVKDLTIEGKFASLHSTMENSSWSADASIGYGPFRFGPKYSGGKSQFHKETTQNGYKLTNEGYQLIGTINAFVPKCPSK